MSFQKPLVTIELDEYNKMLEYIKLLDDSIGDSCNKYKKALQEIISNYSKVSTKIYSINPSETFREIISDALVKNKIKVNYDNYEIE